MKPTESVQAVSRKTKEPYNWADTGSMVAAFSGWILAAALIGSCTGWAAYDMSKAHEDQGFSAEILLHAKEDAQCTKAGGILFRDQCLLGDTK